MSDKTNYTVSFQAMGSHIQAWLAVTEPEQIEALQAVPAWFESWEAILSRFRPESELSQLNAQTGRWCNVSAVLGAVLGAARQSAEATGGLVTPFILPALEAAGYDHSFDPERFQPGPARPFGTCPDWETLQVDQSGLRVRIPPGSRIDLGGIAKGWAAQQAAELLSQFGPCLIDAGGDLVARGSPDESDGWLVDAPDPDDPHESCLVRLIDSAIATSGTDYRRWTRDGQMLHHLIDPRTGQPSVSRVLTATVVARDAVQAEASAKAALISGQFPALPSVLVYQDGSADCNLGWEELIQRAQYLSKRS